MPLTPKQQRFVDEYLIDLNATQAAIRAGYSAHTANEMGAENLAKPSIAAAIAEAVDARKERTEITADKVLRHWWALATADPNELIEFRRTCCRSCYGVGGGYQRTALEMERDRSAHAKAIAAFKPGKGKEPPGAFNEQGGAGYDPREEPNDACPVCFGEGVGAVFPKDTRSLSDSARKLYAGVKQTKEGLEIKVHDQAAALANVAKHLGMFTDKLEVSGPGGAPLLTRVSVVCHRVAAEERPAIRGGGADPGDAAGIGSPDQPAPGPGESVGV